MGFFDIFKKARANYNVTWTLNSAGEWIYPNNNSDSYINEGYKALPNVYSVISMILDKSTQVPFEVFKVKNKAKEQKYKALMIDPKNAIKALRYKSEAYDRVENSDLEALLLKPNNYQSINELWFEIDGYKMLTGNSYLYQIGAGSTQELHSIPATCVELHIKGNNFSPEFNYKVSYLDQQLPQEDIYHFKYWNPIVSGKSPNKQFNGQSPLQACRLLLGRYKDADITQGFMFKNMGPVGLLTGDKDTDITQDQAISLQDRFKQQHTGVHKANDIIITPSKLSWTSIGLSPVDLNITQGKREMLSEICNVYKVPIGLLSDTNSTENNMIESRKALITDAVIPLVEARKAVLNKFLAPKFGQDLRIEFDYTVFSEMQEDIQKQSQVAMAAYILTIDERRSIMGYDNLDPGEREKVLIPSGLSTLEDLYSMPDEINEPLLDPNAN